MFLYLRVGEGVYQAEPEKVLKLAALPFPLKIPLPTSTP